ncbi:MAG: hypothetical protein Alpg2KO_10240 [Alphaproteobacteria bacterium]
MPEEAVAVLALHRAAVMRLAGRYPAAARDAWSGPITQRRIDDYHKNGQEETRLIVRCSRTNRLAGFGAVVLDKAELRACYVHPDFARKGVGRLLMNRLEALALAHGVTQLTLDGSVNALEFYQLCGWRVKETATHVVGGRYEIDCVVMFKDLK